ncbi:MAG TPA: class I SAM-dependent methyltransferase [Actinomycetales bacterium]|nr:class I SAM-dependent methyltransferase [Actinomycetales bacterium]
MRDVVPSPNIWHHPETYELENRGLDAAGVIDSTLREIGDWSGLRVLDVGCGNGFHLPTLAGGPGAAAHVTGVEPHPQLAAAAARRVSGLDRVEVLEGTAAALPLPPGAVDVAHARWAYFFGPGCEPGLAELDRVVAPGGTSIVVDTDAARSTFGGWFRRERPGWDPVAVERFWARHGWSRRGLDVELTLPDRASFEAVVRIELSPSVADEVLAGHRGTSVDHAVVVRWRRR